MFKERINKTPFCNDSNSECLYGNIQYYQNSDFFSRIDRSLISTLRALLLSRIKETSFDTMVFYSNNPFDYITDYDLSICFFEDLSKSGQMGKWRKGFYSAWQEVDKVNIFFKNRFNCVCMIKPSKKKTIIICDANEFNKHFYENLHLLQVSIPVALPWFFEDKPLNDDEKELIYSLKGDDPNKYLACLAKIATAMKANFYDDFLKANLKDFELVLRSKQKSDCEYNIIDINNAIKKIEDDLSDLLKRKDEAEIRLLGIEQKISQSSQQSELLNYFQCNKNIELIQIDSNNQISFLVKTVCENFDEGAIDNILKFSDSNSFAYDEVNFKDDVFTPTNIDRLMKAIFIEKKIRLRLCAIYSLGFRESPRGLCYQDITYSSVIDDNTYLYNPHIYFYGCLGGYTEAINLFLKENDLVGAISQCIASCSSLNLYDTPVVKMLVKGFFEDKAEFLEIIETGEVMKPSQAIKYLNEREGN